MKKKCKACGKEFETKSNRAIYCSDKCKRAAIREKEKPALIKRAKDMSRDKNKVYSLYQGKCAICGWQISENLVIHKGKALPSYGCETIVDHMTWHEAVSVIKAMYSIMQHECLGED